MKKVQLNTDLQNILVREYTSMSDFSKAFILVRGSVLALGIAIIGVLIQNSIEADFPYYYGYNIIACTFLFVLVKMVGATIRATYVFGKRMSEICELFGYADYWKIWSKYSKIRSVDSGTKSSSYLLYFLFFGTAVFVLLMHTTILYSLIDDNSSLSRISLEMLVVIILIIGFIIGLVQIRSETEPDKFIELIDNTWIQANQELKNDDLVENEEPG
jgi:hypothetical protein